MIKKLPGALNKALNLLKLLCHTALKNTMIRAQTWCGHLWPCRLIRQQLTPLVPFAFCDDQNWEIHLYVSMYIWVCFSWLQDTCTRTKNAFLSLLLHPYLNGVWAGRGKKMQTETQLQHHRLQHRPAFCRVSKLWIYLNNLCCWALWQKWKTDHAFQFSRYWNRIFIFSLVSTCTIKPN